MKVIKSILSPKLCTYPLELIGPEADLLFVDIETTGFSAKSSSLYMIGCIYFENQQINLAQFFAEKESEEELILKEFIKLCENHKILIHYNGNNFDIPYLRQKCQQYYLNDPFESLSGVDIYKRIMPYKNLLFLENLKQKTVEDFMSFKRRDLYNGGQLIEIYKQYLKKPQNDLLDLLILHNEEDMKGMLFILPMLSYSDLFTCPFRVTKVTSGKNNHDDGSTNIDVMMKLRFPFQFPKPFVMRKNGCYFSCENAEGKLSVPIVYGKMKYFYSNYKDYYYLPKEDTAIHKSVASYVDAAYRKQATAKNCYTIKEGSFLPQWDILYSPVFKKEYEDKILYFELTDDIKHSPSEFGKYALHLLDMMAHSKS